MRTIMLGTIIISLFILGCGSSEKEIVLNELTDTELMEMAAKYFETKNYDKAIETYDYIKKNFPDTDYFVEVNIGKARAFGKKEQYEDQLDLIYKTLKANIMPQKVPRIYVEIGNFYQKFAPFDPGLSGTGGMEEDYKIAINFYKKAMQYDESNDKDAKSEALANIGLVSAKQKNYEEATKTYQNFLKAYPQSPYYLSVSQRLNNVQNISPLQIIYPENVKTEESDQAPEEKEVQVETENDQNKQENEIIQETKDENKKEQQNDIIPEKDKTAEQPQENSDQPQENN